MDDRWVRPAAWQHGIYLANAAAGLSPAPVIETVTRHLRREGEIGGPAAATEAGGQLAQAYRGLARLLNAETSEVAFTESGNRGLQMLIASLRLQPGDRVLVDRSAWGGILAMLASLGVEVVVLPSDEFGRVDAGALPGCIDERVKLVLLTWCPSISGMVNPAAAVGAALRGSGVVYILDACQALGQVPIDVKAIGCDALAASGRKWLRGPRGTAVLFAAQAFLDRFEPFMPDQFGASLQAGKWSARADARRYETGESCVAGRLGLGTAIDGALSIGIAEIERAVRRAAGRLRQGLAEIAGVTVHDRGPDLSAIVTFGIDGLAAAEAAQRMADQGITVSAMGALYGPFDMEARGLADVIRAAPHIFTNDDELGRVLGVVAAVAARPG